MIPITAAIFGFPVYNIKQLAAIPIQANMRDGIEPVSKSDIREPITVTPANTNPIDGFFVMYQAVAPVIIPVAVPASK